MFDWNKYFVSNNVYSIVIAASAIYHTFIDDEKYTLSYSQLTSELGNKLCQIRDVQLRAESVIEN